MKKYLSVLVLPLILYGCGTNIENTQLQPNVSESITQETTSESLTENSIDETSIQTTSLLQELSTQTSIDTTSITTNITTTLENTSITTTPITTTITTTNVTAMGFNDNELIGLAQSLYEVAEEMVWKYFYDTPYPLDYDNSIQDDHGNIYYMIDDENITSMEDIENDWLTIFSNKYHEMDFGNRFLEQNNRVYVNDAPRNSSIYYDYTEITEVTSKSNDGKEVFFKAVSHYIDPYNNTPMDDQVNEFSIVLEDDSYHVGKFTSPY